MNIRFEIKNTASKAETEGDTIVRFSGVSEPFHRVSERASTLIGVDGGGNAKLTFTTGLDEKRVQFYDWYTPEEKEVVKEQIVELKKLVTDAYGGEEVVSPTNKYFWGENRNVNRLSLSNQEIDQFYDTKNPAHALLYLSIISGAFMETVAPTQEWAERNQIPHYMMLDTEESFSDEDEFLKSDAHAALSELRKNDSEALFILAWCLQYDTVAYGAYLRSTSARDLVNYHIKYIDGKLQLKRKRNTPKIFLEYVEKWNGQQTRPLLYTEAYVKAGEYYSFINPTSDSKFTMNNGKELGNTVDEAVKKLTSAKGSKDLEVLRDLVEAKWKE